jgi:purine-binding chemotaxis protein CheW
LRLDEIREIVFLAELSRPPGLPAVVEGVLNLGGDVVPVLRLDRLLGLPEMTPALYTPLLVLRDAEPPVALMVETVRNVVAVAGGSILPVPSDHSFNDCVEGMVTLTSHAGDRAGVILLLSAERLLLEKEQQHLAELQDREQARLREWEVGSP